jgi:hypothetical protein
MAECAYCGDEVVGKGVTRNSRVYCSNECADYDEEEFDEDDDELGEDEGSAEDE